MGWASVRVTTPPAARAVTVADLRARLRIDGDDGDADEDALLADLIRTAEAQVDGPDGLGIALMAQTWTLTLDAFPAEIVLPGWPVTAVAAVRYLDTDGVEQTLDPATYRLVGGADPVRLVLQPSKRWPSVLAGRGVVMVDYTLGQADVADLDPGLVTALCLMAGHWYENREAVVIGQAATELPLGARAILARFSRVAVS